MDSDDNEYLEKTGDIQPEKFNGSDRIDKSENKDASKRPKQNSYRHDEDFDHQVKRERKERQKDRRSRESKNMDMDRERENSRRKDRYKDKIRERNRDRGRDREKRDRDLNHNRNQSERYQEERERERSRDRGRSHDMEYKEREREREARENNPESRRTKEEREKVAEPEADPERDQRTVFAYQISLKADERNVYEFFTRAGKVRDVRLIMDRNSRRSKGVGYIEFYDVMSVPAAIALSGQPLLGQPVMVKPSEAEKNLVHSTTVAAGLISPSSGEGRQLYVQNLHLSMKEDQLRQVFEPFGTVELVELPSDPETGHSKGYGFIQFACLEDARAAQSLDGQLEIAGKMMKVSAVTDQAGRQEAGDFVDDGDDSLPLSVQSGKVLMQKLDCTVTSASVVGSLGASPAVSHPVAPFGQTSIPALTGLPAAVPSINTIGIPSECLLLKNMFDPKVESEPDFDQDVKEDVEDECTKFGDLKHIYVDKNTAGFVYLRFQKSQSSIAAQRALHGRWFAGKMITATFVMPQDYEAKFPESK